MKARRTFSKNLQNPIKPIRNRGMPKLWGHLLIVSNLQRVTWGGWVHKALRHL